MKGTARIRGQTSLWDFAALIEEAAKGAGKEHDGGDVKWKDASAYLFKGERLRSLAREHFERRGGTASDAERKLYGLSIDAVESRAARDAAMLKLRTFVGGLLRGMKEEGDGCARAIGELTGGRVSVIPRPDLARLKGILKGAQDDVIVEVRVAADGRDGLSFFALKNAPDDARKKRISIHEGFLVQDARTVIAYCVMYAEAKKAASEEWFRSEMARKVRAEEDGRERRTAFLLWAACRQIAADSWPVITGLRTSGREFTEAVKKRIDGGNRLRVLLADAAGLDEREIDLLSQVGIDAVLTKKPAAELKAGLAEWIRKSPRRTFDEGVPYFISDAGCLREAARAFWKEGASRGVLPDFGTCFFARSRFGRGQGSFWADHFAFDSRFGRSPFDEWLFEAFFEVFRRKSAEVERIRECEEAERGHARSFENKAGLPRRTVEAMLASPLNDVFGFVEYDEDVDLEKAAVFERTFLEVRRRYLAGFDASRNAIRLRRLGNHRATGLYYPGVRCLCVDYRHPSSFLHEFGHLMDYEGGDLSLSAEFEPVRDEYERWIKGHRDAIPKRGKYGVSYYLTPTEVFARSFEAYCRGTLGLTCCLLPEKFNEAVYPSGERYEGLVAAYFDGLLGRKKEGGFLRETA